MFDRRDHDKTEGNKYIAPFWLDSGCCLWALPDQPDKNWDGSGLKSGGLSFRGLRYEVWLFSWQPKILPNIQRGPTKFRQLITKNN